MKYFYHYENSFFIYIHMIVSMYFGLHLSNCSGMWNLHYSLFLKNLFERERNRAHIHWFTPLKPVMTRARPNWSQKLGTWEPSWLILVSTLAGSWCQEKILKPRYWKQFFHVEHRHLNLYSDHQTRATPFFQWFLGTLLNFKLAYLSVSLTLKIFWDFFCVILNYYLTFVK